VCVDEIAASGGYMMAAVADRIIATPFACIGSIGVVFEMPNFSSFFDKVGVKYLQFTAGKHKRTVSMGMPVDDEGVEKMQEDIDLMHSLFKSHIKENRNTTNIDEVSEGQIWSGIVALEKDLVDELDCSENVILKACNESNVFEIRWEEPKSLMNKLSLAAESCIINVINRLPINSRFLA
jgi:serine protease SohB